MLPEEVNNALFIESMQKQNYGIIWVGKDC